MGNTVTVTMSEKEIRLLLTAIGNETYRLMTEDGSASPDDFNMLVELGMWPTMKLDNLPSDDKDGEVFE